MSRLATVAAVAVSATLLGGCGTGLGAQTYKETGRSDGASADLDTLAIRDVHVEQPTTDNTIPAGGQAVLTGTFVNRGTTPDALTGISTDAAGAVTLTDNGRPASSLTVPAGGLADSWAADLDGLTAQLSGGSYITVTLTFTSGGQKTLLVPVQIGDGGLANRQVDQSPSGEGG